MQNLIEPQIDEVHIENKISWKRITLFFVIATLSSYIFRLDRFNLKPDLNLSYSTRNHLLTVILEGFGVLLAALIAIYLLKCKRKIEMSFFGTSISKSIIISIIPIIIVTTIGIQNDFQQNTYVYGLIAVIATLLYCLIEEYGWRGYLQEELKSLKPWHKYVIIGLMWYLWHLTFLIDYNLVSNLSFLTSMIAASWGIGQVANATRSILACASYHLLFQIMIYNSFIKNGLDGTQKLIILGVSFTLMLFVIKKWEQKHPLKKSDV